MTVTPPPPPVVLPPKKDGCWKWGAIGCVAAIVLLAAGAGVITMIVFGAIKSTDAYRGARASVERDPRVIEALGSPVRAGFWVIGTMNVDNGRGDADINFSVKGPRGRAIVHAVATKQSGEWRYSELTVTPRHGTGINLLQR